MDSVTNSMEPLKMDGRRPEEKEVERLQATLNQLRADMARSTQKLKEAAFRLTGSYEYEDQGEE